MHPTLDWTLLPDLCAVVLLTVAFGSVARRGQTPISRVWLIGWVMIALHFAALIFASVPGLFGTIASLIAWNSLAWAGVLFMWACVPYRNRPSSRAMLIVLLATNTLYITLINTVPQARIALVIAALLYGLAPLAVTLIALRQGFSHPMRWSSVILNGALCVFLLLFQMRPTNGPDLAFNAVIFTVYMGCCIHFLFAYCAPPPEPSSPSPVSSPGPLSSSSPRCWTLSSPHSTSRAKSGTCPNTSSPSA